MKKDDRSFTVVAVKKPNQKGQATRKYPGRYIAKTPRAAASKALTYHCNKKRIHGACTLIIVVQETTAGSAKKMFAYKGKRIRQDTEVEYGDTVVTYKFAPNKLEAVPVPQYVYKRDPENGRRKSRKSSKKSSKKSKKAKKARKSKKKSSKKTKSLLDQAKDLLS